MTCGQSATSLMSFRVDVCRSQGERGAFEEAARGTFRRGAIIDIDPRWRVGRAIGKDEQEGAAAWMAQRKARGHPDAPPAIAGDGQGSDRDTMVETGGQAPEYAGRGRPPTRQQAQSDWRYLQGIQHRSGSKAREMLEASCAGEDGVYNRTRPLKTWRVEVYDGRRR